MKNENKETQNSTTDDLLLEIRNTLKSVSVSLEKIEVEIKKQRSSEVVKAQDSSISTEKNIKKTSSIRRVDNEEEKVEQEPSYTIKVVGLGTTKLDF